jgi:UDP-glucose 4-epimerase
MNVLITGGAGFVGSWTARRLLSAGWDVIVYDQAPSDKALGLAPSSDDLARLTVVAGRTTDSNRLRQTCVENGVTHVVHLASPLTSDCIENPKVLVQGMVQAFVNLLELSRELGLQRIVWASSVSVYGPAERYPGAVNEDSARRPTTLYGSGKVLCEDLAAHYGVSSNIDAIGLRFPVLFGQGNLRGVSSWIARLCERTARGEPAEVPWGGCTVNLMYVEDVAELVAQVLNAGETSTRTFTVSGDTIAVSDMIAFVHEVEPKADVRVVEGRLELPWNLDASRLATEIGFRSSIDVRSGMRRIIDAARDTARREA